MADCGVRSRFQGEIIPRQIRALVFDCDGVLFDSKEANVQFYNHILKQVGHPPVHPDQREYIHMHPVRESLFYLLGECPQFEAAIDYCQGIDFRAFNRYLRVEPGLIEVLERARLSYRIALATNRTVSTREVLSHFDLDQYFDFVVSASDVRFPKPHPEAMERIVDAFEVGPGEILYIGDSSVDEALAAVTGVFFAAYKNPNLEAHIHLSHFRELHPILFVDKEDE